MSSCPRGFRVVAKRRKPRNPDTDAVRKLYGECEQDWATSGCARILRSANSNHVKVELLRDPGVPAATPEEMEEILRDDQGSA